MKWHEASSTWVKYMIIDLTRDHECIFCSLALLSNATCWPFCLYSCPFWCNIASCCSSLCSKMHLQCRILIRSAWNNHSTAALQFFDAVARQSVSKGMKHHQLESNMWSLALLSNATRWPFCLYSCPFWCNIASCCSSLCSKMHLQCRILIRSAWNNHSTAALQFLNAVARQSTWNGMKHHQHESNIWSLTWHVIMNASFVHWPCYQMQHADHFVCILVRFDVTLHHVVHHCAAKCICNAGY